MKVEAMSEDTRLALRAMRRAAHKVLLEAVQRNEKIPLWDGKQVYWQVPTKQLRELEEDMAADE